MENNISERISVGSRQTSITRTSQYSKHLAIETQSQSSESSRTSGYGSFTNGSVPNGHQISVASQSQYLLDGQDTDLIQSKGLVTSQVSRVSFSHLILSTTIHYPNLLFYWAYILKIDLYVNENIQEGRNPFGPVFKHLCEVTIIHCF